MILLELIVRAWVFFAVVTLFKFLLKILCNLTRLNTLKTTNHEKF